MKCDLCGNEGYPRQAVLLGGYRCQLCDRCLNLWHFHLIHHEIYCRYAKAKCRKDALIAQCLSVKNGASLLDEAVEQVLEIDEKLFVMGQLFVESPEEEGDDA